MDDLIYRQAAIQTALEFIVEYLDGAFDDDFQKKLMERMNNLPSAQPTQSNTPNALTALDCISRHAALDECLELAEARRNWGTEEGQAEIRGIDAVMCALHDLPSAQPEHKHGKWVLVRDEEAGNALYMCSACGKGDIHAPEVKVSYCWNCGAEMRGAEDE